MMLFLTVKRTFTNFAVCSKNISFLWKNLKHISSHTFNFLPWDDFLLAALINDVIETLDQVNMCSVKGVKGELLVDCAVSLISLECFSSLICYVFHILLSASSFSVVAVFLWKSCEKISFILFGVGLDNLRSKINEYILNPLWFYPNMSEFKKLQARRTYCISLKLLFKHSYSRVFKLFSCNLCCPFSPACPLL